MTLQERLGHEISTWQKKYGTFGSSKHEDLRIIFTSYFKNFSSEFLDEIFSSFVQKVKSDTSQGKIISTQWLTAIGSIFIEDYNNFELSYEDWVFIRDLSNDYAGELNMDLVSYIMNLVLEHKALN